MAADDIRPIANVVSLRAACDADSVVRALRNIADDLEAGDPDWPVTTAVIVFGHTSAKPDGPDMAVERIDHTVFGVGPRRDAFSVRGLLATAMTELAGG